MRTPPKELEVGDKLSQEEIETAFNTGFGYRISGINPRRDEQDRRYILLFANEDGPYNDAVTQGRFEYIGEGLEGDQSEDSPGNSALIDAVSSEIPVHFFYQKSGDGRWEYQGLVDALDYEFREREGREVLVFSMNHIREKTEEDNQSALYLIPVSDYWRDKFRNSVESPLNLTQYDDVPPELQGYDELRIWATTETEGGKKQSAIDQMQASDCVLFYYEGDFFAGGTVERTFENPHVGDLIWNQPESRHIYILDNFTTDVPSIEQVWEWIGYSGRQVVRGFSRVADDRLMQLSEDYGSIHAAIFDSGEDSKEDATKKESTNKAEHELDERPDVGETFTAKVDRISSSGNGIIETKEGHINIGPVKPESVGEEITVEMLSGVFAICKNKEYTSEFYNKWPRRTQSYRNLQGFNEVKPIIGSSPNEDQSEMSATGNVEFCDNCGSVMKKNRDQWVCSSCGYKKRKQSQTTDSASEGSEEDETEFDTGSADSTETTQETTTEGTQPDLDEMREQAEQDAMEEVPEDASTTTTTQKQQYNRSQKVKEYVKARADGICEGCGEPAPFTSKTGEPYLHAHHIHELSDGGPDTPDTVVALCPNCHYRVHHGEHGDEFNEELLEIVQEKEK